MTPSHPDLDFYDPLFGYAAGTTGGEGGPIVTCTSLAEAQAAIDKSDGSPLIVFLAGEITGKDDLLVKGKKNLTILGDGASSFMNGVGIRLVQSENVILFNLRIAKVKAGAKDAIGMETDCARVVALHCDLSGDMDAGKDTYDGCFDGKRGTEKYAIVLSKTHDHHKAWLQGYSDSDTKPDAVREFTAALNLVKNVGSRCPSVRFGVAHVWGNVLEDVETSGVNCRQGAQVHIERNTFIRVHNPVVAIDSKQVGAWHLEDNAFEDCSWGKVGKGEASAQDGRSTTDYRAPYEVPGWTREQCAEMVRAYAGILPPGMVVPLPGHGAPDPEPVEQVPEQPQEPEPQPEQPALPTPDLTAMREAADAMVEAVVRFRKALGA
ncbi:hypothetical protein [Roseomonas xinghualingensis]|uniref:pectate lyase family protein n=1 Tax=Roseomonas xinghualingensis TaxID=2986475 RepID=UPI0021F20E75|nr:hypothetical protein [Roseomonas sp. SXEYE001]MCV4209999.1 hypothetical protein [Roseomonas sp. SXEYE001]